MEQNKNNFSMRLLVLICAPKPANKAAKLFHQGAIPVQYKLNGEGTASSEIMDMLGLGSSDKSILISTLPKHFADIMLLKLRRELRLGRQNTGIAFTIPISGASGSILRMLHQLHEKSNSNMRKDDINLTDNKYSLIAAIINRGYSGEVMDVARAAGARGGTIINSRRIGTEEAASFWGLNVLDEKEILLIIATNEGKKKIMTEISEKCGITSDANGLVISLPVDNVIGLGNMDLDDNYDLD